MASRVMVLSLLRRHAARNYIRSGNRNGVVTSGGLMVRSIATATRALSEKRIMKVPSMGDSITEGTIVEWTAVPGQAIKDGDVVAMIETDKVTVEIKGEVDGVITKHFGAVYVARCLIMLMYVFVATAFQSNLILFFYHSSGFSDDTVEVGGDLYEIDTEAEATVEAASASETSETAEATEGTTVAKPDEKVLQNASPPSPSAAETPHSRTPSIKFFGKQGWEALRKGQKPASSTTAAQNSRQSPNAVTTIIADNTIIHPMYGRPKFTEEEIEALIMGGASIAPTVLAHSTGAKFKY
jgi:hypothetical protein